MVIENFTPLTSLAGGIFIGFAAIMLMLFNGNYFYGNRLFNCVHPISYCQYSGLVYE